VASGIFVDFYDHFLARVNTFFGQIYVQSKFFSVDPNDLYEIIEKKSAVSLKVFKFNIRGICLQYKYLCIEKVTNK